MPPYPEPVLSPEELPVAEAGPSAGTVEPPRRRRRAAPAVIALLALLLVAAVVVGAVLVTRLQDRNAEWQASSTRWRALATAAGAQAASAEAARAQAEADLDTTTQQLATAKKRITELADEKAELADSDASRQQLVAYQSRVSKAAGDVAAALTRCVDGQKQLITYLDDASSYDPDDLARYRSDVSSVCGAATDANAALQRALDAG